MQEGSRRRQRRRRRDDLTVSTRRRPHPFRLSQLFLPGHAAAAAAEPFIRPRCSPAFGGGGGRRCAPSTQRIQHLCPRRLSHCRAVCKAADAARRCCEAASRDGALPAASRGGRLALARRGARRARPTAAEEDATPRRVVRARRCSVLWGADGQWTARVAAGRAAAGPRQPPPRTAAVPSPVADAHAPRVQWLHQAG